MASRIAGFRHSVAKNHFQRHFSEDLLLSSFHQPGNRDFGATSNGRLAWVPDLLGQWRVAKPKVMIIWEKRRNSWNMTTYDNMQWLGKSWNYEVRWDDNFLSERTWPVRWMTSQARTCRPVCHSDRILRNLASFCHLVSLHHLFNKLQDTSDITHITRSLAHWPRLFKCHMLPKSAGGEGGLQTSVLDWCQAKRLQGTNHPKRQLEKHQNRCTWKAIKWVLYMELYFSTYSNLRYIVLYIFNFEL